MQLFAQLHYMEELFAEEMVDPLGIKVCKIDAKTPITDGRTSEFQFSFLFSQIKTFALVDFVFI